jgi:four helix bundle protein
MKDFRDLHVWESTHLLTLEIYRTTAQFPHDEHSHQPSTAMQYFPSSQYRGRLWKNRQHEFHRFLTIACGSASELDYELLLARDLGYLGEQIYILVREDLSKVRKMLNSLLQKVDRDRGRMTNSLWWNYVSYQGAPSGMP